MNLKMGFSLFVTTMGLSVSAFAMRKMSPEFGNFMLKAPCADQVKESTSKVLFSQSWYPLMISRPHMKLMSGIAFRNTKTGYGYELFIDRNSTTLTEFNLNGETVSSNVWDQRNACDLRSSDYKSKRAKLPVAAESNKDVFTDKDLIETMKASPWGVIYVWSPNMPLSVSAIKEIKQAMSDQKGKLTILVDGKINMSSAEELLSKGEVLPAEVRQAASSELFSHGMILHYPIAFIYKNGLLSNRTYIGHKKSEIYSKWITKELAEME